MLNLLKHIDFKPIKLDGERKQVLVVEVQPKGEKTTGEKEFVYILVSHRLKKALQKRRFALRNDSDAYVFGTDDGRRQKDFRRMWRELFKLAGLKWGRTWGSCGTRCATSSARGRRRIPASPSSFRNSRGTRTLDNAALLNIRVFRACCRPPSSSIVGSCHRIGQCGFTAKRYRRYHPLERRGRIR